MEKAFLLGVNLDDEIKFFRAMEELALLAEACEYEVVGSMTQNLDQINKALYIGSGKVSELRMEAESLEADIIICNDSLSPSQIRNLKDETQIAILDRNTLILEIFARRAKSREAVLQVEVARLKYLMPRLIGLHEALSRQGGTSGSMSSRGEGEKKLELDRRRIQYRLTQMRKELKEVEKEREVQQKKREKSQIPRVALVGYTNAGKSTIMNGMIDFYMEDEEKKVFEKDMLFATLDTSVRKIVLEDNRQILLSDTVGFIDRLPHDLVEAFKSTLSEAVNADLILHVVDFSDENYKDHIKVTMETLEDIGAGEVPVLYVYNKADLLKENERLQMPDSSDKAVYISAKEKDGIGKLASEILKRVYQGEKVCTLLLPYDRGDIFSYLKENAAVSEVEYEAEGMKVTVSLSKKDQGRMQEFIFN